SQRSHHYRQSPLVLLLCQSDPPDCSLPALYLPAPKTQKKKPAADDDVPHRDILCSGGRSRGKRKELSNAQAQRSPERRQKMGSALSPWPRSECGWQLTAA
ncbi:unnamed protein product, partial [Ectocarpus sp. 8 AP-2014]